jgi:uncharacterized protein (TIGR02145 family)
MEKHLHNPFEKNDKIDYMYTKFFAGLIQLNRKIFTLSSKILLLVLSILFLFTFSLFGQAPQKINFQSIMRNSSGELIENKLVKLRFSIIEGHVNGSKVYIETHSKNTDASGLISLQIGTGTISNGVFSSINWGKAPYFMQLEADFSGGNNFVDLGTEELLSVPYSLYASKTDTTVLNLVNRFGLKLNVSDTASMMVNYRSALNRKVNNSDTASMLANYRTGINAKVNISDTAVMLSNYRIGLNNKLNISDTATMLAPYLRKVDAMNSPETDPIFGSSISKGITGTDTAYWNRKVNISDTVSMLSNYRIGLNEKVNISDTSSMLNPYLRKADATLSSLERQTSLLQNQLKVKDIDGNIYNTVLIGKQVWMKENLRVSRYNNGDIIPFENNGNVWPGASSGLRTWFNHDSVSYAKSFGNLYNWFAATDDRGICPKGFRLPSSDDWNELKNEIGGPGKGGKLIVANTTTGATNETGFSGQGNSFYGSINSFGSPRVWYYWSKEAFNYDIDYPQLNLGECCAMSAVLFNAKLNNNGPFFNMTSVNDPKQKSFGFHIRCLKDNQINYDSLLSSYYIPGDSFAPSNNPTFTGTVSGIDKNMVGLGNVDNTSDVNKPISTATQSALNNKVNVSDTSSMLSNYRIGLNNKVNISDTVTMLAPYLRKVDAMNSPETDPIFGSSIAKGITGIDTAYWNRKVNISDTASMFSNYRTELNNKVNVSDTSDMLANYRNGLNSKAPINNPTFTGTVSGIDKNMIGLGNVDNTSDANKPISTATQTALNNKVNVSDTSSMLSNYRTGLNNKVNVSDTSSMLNPYLRKSEIPLGTTLGNIQYWNGTTWVNLTPGLPGQSLIISSTGIPSWSGAALPTVITDSVSEISITSALVGGNVINDGGETIIERGIVYSTNDNPTLSDGKFSIGSGTGTFSETLGARGDRFGLVPNTTYYVRAFATNRIGTGYGRTDTFSTNNYLSQLPLFQIAIIDATISDRQASVLTKMVKEGNGIINEVGIVYSKFPNPTISDSKTIITNYQGTRLNSLSNDLDQSTKYYVRVYAINDYGISYSNEVQLITKFRPDLVEDFDGNIYGLLQIGNQIWMNENLKVTHFRNGAEIPKIEDDNSWSNLSSAAWSNYNNLKQSPYGKLYNWYSTIGDSICPIGWHVPSNEDFSNLINFLGGNEKAKKFLNTPPSSSWHLNETTNNFNAFPAGIRASNGGFWGINEMVNYWSKTETGINNAVMLYLQAENLTLSDLSFVYEFNKNLGSYIRCLKNN